MESKLEQILDGYDEGLNRSILPSKLQPGDNCYVQVHGDQFLFANVTAVKFTINKVLYDIDVQVDITTLEGGEVNWSRFHGISSDLIITVEERDEKTKK